MMRWMKYLSFSLLLLGIVFAKTARHELGGKKTYVVVNGKKYQYWYLKKGDIAKFSITGYATAKIYVRTQSGEKRNITIYLDDKKVKSFVVDEKVSKKSSEKHLGIITKAKTMELKIPRGKHTIKIHSDDGRVLVRVTYRKKSTGITMAPQKHDGGMVLVANEQELGYYRASKDKAVEYVINGGGTVTLYTRLIFSPEMMGTQHYKLKIQIDDEKPTIYELETVPSSVSYFRGDDKVIPGKAKKIKIKVPKNRHKITVQPEGTTPVAVRLIIPMSMLKAK